MTPEGTGSKRLLVLAEALGEREEREGLPLRPLAQAGSVFQKALRVLGVDRNQLVIANMMWGRPRNNALEGEWYEQTAIDSCHKYVRETIDRFRPKAILALGNVPLKHLTGFSGKDQKVLSVRGYVVASTREYWLDGQVIPVVVGLHPSFIGRGATEYFGAFVHDLGKALDVASGKLREGEHYILDPMGEAERTRYLLRPTEEQIRDFLYRLRANTSCPVTADFETDYILTKNGNTDESEATTDGKIIQVQFSLGPGEAIALGWQNGHREAAVEVFRIAENIVWWNGHRFDRPVAKAAGVQMPGRQWDGMLAWHHSQPDLPQGLQFAGSFYGAPHPWKHLSGVNLQYYGCLDVDVLWRIWARLPGEMRNRGVWQSYVEMVEGLQPILEGMQERGIRVSPEAREKLLGEIEVEKGLAMRELQEGIPEDLKPKDPKNGYVSWPPEVKEVWQRWTGLKVVKKKDYWEPLGGEDSNEAKMLRTEISEKTGLVWRTFNGIKRPVRIEDFLPNSTQQVQALIKHYGQKVPKSLDGDETTAKGELRKLAQRCRDEKVKYKQPQAHALADHIDRILSYRELNKISSTYIEGWPLGSDGCVHTTWTFRPATGQLSAIEPPVQTAPAHGGLAKRFKETMVASPGCTLIKFDYQAFHLKTMGFEAEDETYIRMACIDGHAFVLAHIIRGLVPQLRDKAVKTFPTSACQETRDLALRNIDMLSEAVLLLEDLDSWPQMEDQDLRYRLLFFKRNFKFIRDTQAKPSLLGVQLMLQAKKLYEMNRNGFKNKAQAQGVIDLILKKLYPKVAQYQTRVLNEAAQKGFLISRYGFIRHFYGVRRWDAKKQMEVKGEEAESAVSFYVQNDAFGKMREAMLDLRERGLDEKYRMTNNIHDAAVFDCPDEFVDEAVVTVKEVMEAPARKLVNRVAPRGLVCSVDCEMGPNMGALKEVKI
jgi:uracil-DNA glycosylase family 4